MPAAPAIAAGIGAAASIAGTAVSASQGRGGEGESGYKLPTPGAELQMLEAFNTALQNNQSYMDYNTGLIGKYDERMSTVEQMAKGLIPSQEALTKLSANTYDLVSALGGDAAQAIKGGFLDEYSAKMAGLIEGEAGGYKNTYQQELDLMRSVEGQNYKDPNLENKLNDQQRQLEQDLARAGVGPAQRQIALSQFQRQAEEMRFSRAEELRQGVTQRAMSRISAAGSTFQGLTGAYQTAAGLQMAGRQFQLSRAQLGLQAGMTGLEYAAAGVSGLGQLYQSVFATGQQYLSAQQQLSTQPLAMYGELGKYVFSKQTQQAMEGGLTSMPTYYSQTGQTTKTMDNAFKAQQNVLSRQANEWNRNNPYFGQAFQDVEMRRKLFGEAAFGGVGGQAVHNREYNAGFEQSQFYKI